MGIATSRLVERALDSMGTSEDTKTQVTGEEITTTLLKTLFLKINKLTIKETIDLFSFSSL